MDKEKTAYYRDRLVSCDQKDLFSVVDKMINGSKRPTLPLSYNVESLPDRFSTFFHEKIRNLRNSLGPESLLSFGLDGSCHYNLSEFQLLLNEEIECIIKRSTAKSCRLDPLPTAIVKNCAELLSYPITTIVNSSLASGTVPTSLKTAVITPVIKKANLDQEILSNYRPISNLPFLSKILERVVAKQLYSYLSDNGLHAKFQSAYRCGAQL
jgi:hypothetical protein